VKYIESDRYEHGDEDWERLNLQNYLLSATIWPWAPPHFIKHISIIIRDLMSRKQYEKLLERPHYQELVKVLQTSEEHEIL
jgi:hypothetical protein